MFFTKHSPFQLNWRTIWECTRRRNLLAVPFAQNVSSTLIMWQSIWNCMPRIGPSVVPIVLEATLKTVLCRLTWRLIQVWNCTAVPILKKMPMKNTIPPGRLQRMRLRSPILAMSAENRSRKQVYWLSIRDFTQEKGLMLVISVIKLLHRRVCLKLTWGFTLGRNLSAAPFAQHVSASPVTWRSIWNCILLSAVPNVKKFLNHRLPERNILSPATR